MLTVVNQFVDGFMHVCKRCVTLRLFEPAVELGAPAFGQLLEGADIKVAIVEERFKSRHVIHQEATILAELGGGPTAERQRDASLRAWEINFVGRWGRGEYNDAWGYGIFADSIMPTS